ncbi:hypothetical protein IU427_19320 [Nocardia beijingensis]|uniref:WXG100 family type VII secretion target n=1 Tax=Nocardia beijingensis TaxID=95162 RepID=UPI001896254D|nr:WXG100 family type VII secretion target [Nocardia beijingensis]MBF6467316.1 hypothetical protein [Nocardia beijingensis]
MVIDIPSEVALFLNICGIPYPDINEDDVRALAAHVRTFAAQVRDTHDSATGVIGQMGDFYSGESYQQLVATWARMSSTHMRQLDSACEFVGKALDVAATVITAVKIAVLAELAALAVAYASILVTPPLAPSAPLVVAAARRLCEEMAQYLIGYIVAEVIGKAIEPLEQAIDDMVSGIVYDATRDALDIPSSGKPTPLRIDPDAVQHFAKVLDDHADDIMRHAATFADNVATLDFTTSMPFDAMVPPAATDGGPPGGPVLTPEQLLLRHGEQPETRFGTAGPTGLPGHGAGDAPVPATMREPANAAATGERPAGRNEFDNDGAAPVRAGDRSASHAEAEARGPVSDTAKMSQVSAPHSAASNATDAPTGLESPRARVVHPGADAAAAAAHDAVPADPAYSQVGRPGLPSGVAPAGDVPVIDQLASDSPVMAESPGIAPLAQQGGGAATPWGRAPQPVGASNSNPKPGPPVKVPPKVRRPAATPWAKSRRTRQVPPGVQVPAEVQVPAGVYAPSTRPPLSPVPEKGSEANGAKDLADANPAPSRVTASASDPGNPPPPRA